MPIIHRHLLKAFLRYLGYTLVGSLVLFIVLDLLGHSTSLLDNDATPSMVFRFYLYKSAFIVDTVMPIAMLMATLFTVGSMARYLELSALFSSGWSLMYVTRPLVVLAVLASLGSLAWREYVLPEANLRRYRVWEVEIHKNPDRIKPTSDISLTGPGGRLYHADKFDPNTGILTGLKVVTTEGARVLERIDAQRAEWDGQNWTLVDGVRRRFTDQGEDITHFERLTAGDLQVNPKSFYRERGAPGGHEHPPAAGTRGPDRAVGRGSHHRAGGHPVQPGLSPDQPHRGAHRHHPGLGAPQDHHRLGLRADLAGVLRLLPVHQFRQGPGAQRDGASPARRLGR